MNYNMEQFDVFARRMGINTFHHNCYICFIITWIYYNSYYNEFTHNKNNNNDKEKATNELNFHFVNNQFLSVILNEFQSIEGPADVMDNGNRVGVIDMRNESTGVRNVKRVDMAGSDLKKILLMIYQIRCNLIHGDKMRTPYETDEQLLRWASSSLRMLMNNSNLNN